MSVITVSASLNPSSLLIDDSKQPSSQNEIDLLSASLQLLNHQQKNDDVCCICYTEKLSSLPNIELKCGHIFHTCCIEKQVQHKWNGARITFGFLTCPLCKQDICHTQLDHLTQPLYALRQEVQRKAVLRLKYEKLENHIDIITNNSLFYNNLNAFAFHKYAYYLCYKCQKPYYGGDKECAVVGDNNTVDASTLICGGCSSLNVQACTIHGKDFLEFKCRFCCSIAIWFCFGTTHFCDKCHNNNGVLCNKSKSDLVQCPCKPSGSDNLPAHVSGACPLGTEHPPSGEEYGLGCGLCRNLKEF